MKWLGKAPALGASSQAPLGSVPGFTQQLSGLRGERFVWSPGESEMLQALPQHRVRWGGAVRLSSRLPPSGRWTSSSGRGMPDGKVSAHRANFRLHSSSGSSLHEAPCTTQLRFKLRGPVRRKSKYTYTHAPMHIHMHPCTHSHTHTFMHIHTQAQTHINRHARTHTYLPPGKPYKCSFLSCKREGIPAVRSRQILFTM